MSETTKSAANGAGKRYMTDDRGNPSSMRLMSMLALGVAAVLALVEAFGLGSGESKTELVPVLPGRGLRAQGGAEVRGEGPPVRTRLRLRGEGLG